MKYCLIFTLIVFSYHLRSKECKVLFVKDKIYVLVCDNQEVNVSEYTGASDDLNLEEIEELCPHKHTLCSGEIVIPSADYRSFGRMLDLIVQRRLKFQVRKRVLPGSIVICLRSEQGYYNLKVHDVNPLTVIDTLLAALQQNEFASRVTTSWKLIMPMIWHDGMEVAIKPADEAQVHMIVLEIVLHLDKASTSKTIIISDYVTIASLLQNSELAYAHCDSAKLKHVETSGIYVR